MMDKVVRINTRISSKLNDWLDVTSIETGLSKSSIVMIAVEQYKMQTQAINVMDEILIRLKSLEDKIEVTK